MKNKIQKKTNETLFLFSADLQSQRQYQLRMQLRSAIQPGGRHDCTK